MSVHYFRKANSKVNLFKYINDTIIQPTSFLIKEENQLLTSENTALRKNNEDLSDRIEQLFLEFGLVSTNGRENKEINRRYQDQSTSLSYQPEDTSDGKVVHHKTYRNIDQEVFKMHNKENRKSDEMDQGQSNKNVKDSLINTNLQNNSRLTISSPAYIDIYDSRDNIINGHLGKSEFYGKNMPIKSDKFKTNDNISDKNLRLGVHPIYSEIDKHMEDNFNFAKQKVHSDKRVAKITQNSHIDANNLNSKLIQENDPNFAILTKTFNEKLDEINFSLKNHLSESHLSDNSEKSTKNFTNLLENQNMIIDLLNKNSEVLFNLNANLKNNDNELSISKCSYSFSGNHRNSENNLEISIMPSLKSEHKATSNNQKSNSHDFGNNFNFEVESEMIIESKHIHLESSQMELLESTDETQDKYPSDKTAQSLFPKLHESSEIAKMITNLNLSADSFSNDLESSYETLYDPVIYSSRTL